VAFYEPELMNQEVFFFVRSPGYEFPKDGFGFEGIKLRTVPGGSAILRIRRHNLAERLCRLTGEGIYRDSLLLGQPLPPTYQPLRGGVLGCDSILAAVYRGKVYWFWGDTQRAGYPLGNFWTTGATSPLPGPETFDPEAGIPYQYFVGEDNFVRAMAPLSRKGPVWLNGPVVLRDAAGNEQMYAHYAVIDPNSTSFQAVERGLAVYTPDKELFERLEVFPPDVLFPDGAHPLLWQEGEKTYVYFCNPFPLLRVPASEEALRNPACYEAFTPLEQGSPLAAKRWDLTPDGELNWGWKATTVFLGPPQLAEEVRAGNLRAEQAFLLLYDVLSGKPVLAHRGSLAWNDYRRCFVLIFTEIGGTSFLGEVWYAEAESLAGPWAYAQKIVTHHRYSFYNPKHHPFFDREGGRMIYFEGTYSASFSDAPLPTPYYDYNQILYRLDLGHPELQVPVPVYECSDTDGPGRLQTRWSQAVGHYPKTDSRRGGKTVRFWAWDRPGKNLAPVYEVEDAAGKRRLSLDMPPPAEGTGQKPLFYILPLEDPPAGRVDPEKGTATPKAPSRSNASRRAGKSGIPAQKPIVLTEWQLPDGSYCYTVGEESPPAGSRRIRDVGRVLPHPYSQVVLR
jgi:hypothetical protein